MDNISKIVLVENIGKRVGYVLDVAIDYSDMHKVGYYVVDEESESEFLVKCEDVLMITDQYVVISDVSAMQFDGNRHGSLLGKEILGDNFQSYGRVVSAKFNKQKMEKLLTDKCEILPKFIKNVGQDVVFVEFKRKRTKILTGFPKAKSDVAVTIQDAQNVVMPEKVNLASSYYIGKICGENIFGYNNEKIILKNEVITKAVVEKAKKHNRLNQLFFAIKR